MSTAIVYTRRDLSFIIGAQSFLLVLRRAARRELPGGDKTAGTTVSPAVTATLVLNQQFSTRFFPRFSAI